MNGRIDEIIKLSIDIRSEIEEHEFWYEFVEFYEDGFDLKVHFENPLNVSKNEKGDFLFVTILNKSRYLFASAENGGILRASERKLKKFELPS
jgi:hypothetical protein